VGTGSGILAIAAVKLGYAPVHAFDFDPESVRVARANARVNHVERKLSITRRDLTRLPIAASQRYDLVCANLISTLLIAERKRIVARVKPGGTLVVAGILHSEFGEVRAAFEALGLRLGVSQREQEWTSGTFVFER
jgi:ribosomal protein L11 methyltransferase